MRTHRHRLILFAMIAILLITSCGGGGSSDDGPTEAASTQQVSARDAACPVIVSEALKAVDVACQGTGRNQVCYGNVNLSSQFRADISPPRFEQPGDIAALSDINTLQLSPMNTENEVWGVALMRLQSEMEGTLPGQLVTFLLFGDVQIQPTESEDGVQAFYFQTGIGDAPCQEAPDSGILVQTPAGVQEVAMRMNGVDILLGSTAYLQAQPGADMTVSVVEGQAEVTAQGEMQIARAGTQTRIELDANNQPVSEPSEPQPYDGPSLRRLPVQNLDRQISIANRLLGSDFIDDADGWTIFQDGSEIEHNTGDATAEGYICSTDQGQGIYWYFQAPEEWHGDRSEAYGGMLTFALRESAQGVAVEDDVILEGGGLTLAHRLDTLPSEAWTRYEIPLTEVTFTNTATGAAATEAEMQQALADLTGLRIRGEYISGGDTGCLDYVQINAELSSTAPYQPPAREQAAVPEIRTDTQTAPIGTSISDAISQAGEVDSYTFTAADGQAVFFDSQADMFDLFWSLADANGNTLFNERMYTSNDPGVYTLEAGEYTISVTGDEAATGDYTFQTWDVPAPQTFELALNTTVSPGVPADGAGVIESPGVRDIYTFSVDPGTTLFFDGEGEVYEINWTLRDDAGNAIFADESVFSNVDPGQRTLERGGSYTITVSGSGDTTGDYTFTIRTISDEQQFTVNVGDVVTPDESGVGNIDTAGAADVFTFTANPGERIYFDSQGLVYEIDWKLTDEAGNVLFDQTIYQSEDPGALTLERGGSYTLTVSSDDDTIGEYAFQLWPQVEPQTFAIEVGQTVSEDNPSAGAGILETVGALDVFTFSVEPGTNIYFDGSTETWDILWSLYDSTGAPVFEDELMYTGSDTGIFPLNRGGEYRLEVFGDDTTTGSYEFTLTESDGTTTTTLEEAVFTEGGVFQTIEGEIGTPGETDNYTFEMEPGRVLYFDSVSGSTDIVWDLADSEGNRVFSGQWTRENDDPGRYELALGGEYTITVTGRNEVTGPYSIQLWYVPTTQTYPAAITQYDPEVEAPEGTSGEIAWPGEEVRYTFTAEEPGQAVYFDALEGSTDISWSLTDARGNNTFNGQWTRENDDPGRYELALGGEYTLHFDGRGDVTGPFRFTMYDVPPTQTYPAAIKQYDPQVEAPEGTSGEITVPGEEVRFTFAAEPGQVVYFDALEGSTDIIWDLIDADGNTVFNGQWTRENDDPGRYELALGGEYTLRFDGRGDVTGPFRFTMYDVPQTQTYTVEITEYDPEVEAPEGISGEITVPGEEVRYTFEAEPGQVVYFDALEGSVDITWDLFDADGNTVFNGQWTRETDDPGRYELALGGEYTLRFDGRRDVTGPFRFTVYDVPQTPAYTINVGDTVARNRPQRGAGTLAVPGEIDTYTFSVRAGTTVDFQALAGSTDIIWSVTDPNGTAVFSNQWTRQGDGPGVHTLAAGGEYTITVSGRGATTGDYSFSIGRG